MSRHHRDRLTNLSLALGMATVAVLPVGCTTIGTSNTYTEMRHNQYMARRNSITLGLGDAKEANRVIQTTDPWPRYSANRQLTHDGNRMLISVERYKTNTSIEPKGTSTSDVASDTASSSAAPSQP